MSVLIIIVVLTEGRCFIQQHIDRKRSEINIQCDMLLAEIENKRSFFLADLEYEERIRQNEQEELIKVMERILGSSQALYSYTSEVLNENVSEFLEVILVVFIIARYMSILPSSLMSTSVCQPRY